MKQNRLSTGFGIVGEKAFGSLVFLTFLLTPSLGRGTKSSQSRGAVGPLDHGAKPSGERPFLNFYAR